ncbi:delta-aminolevulinic acid dehydratase, chloroplastic-like isoform X2 [Asparagus officinalis]|nr:delta-aminolevulinic acid dehydratase, chloroplastic-like isoform X2 [Asparagus officinalis]
MASTVSLAHSNCQLLRPNDVQSYIGLRPMTAQISMRTMPVAKARPLTVIRASNKQETSKSNEQETSNSNKQETSKSSGLSNEECEANAVAGNFPDPPPFSRPSAPKGTPNVKPLSLTRRPRRNRQSAALRASFQETHLTPANLVLPLFIHEGENDTPIEAMPGCFRLGWKHGLLDEVNKARDVGVNSFVLFPKIPDALKSPTGDEAYNDNGLVPRTIRLLKDKFPDIVIYTDVALDPYSSDGHDGIVREDGVIMNDETVHQLCKQAVSQARAGADVVSPSDMMDGRVGAIRAALDAEGFENVLIM